MFLTAGDTSGRNLLYLTRGPVRSAEPAELPSVATFLIKSWRGTTSVGKRTIAIMSSAVATHFHAVARCPRNNWQQEIQPPKHKDNQSLGIPSLAADKYAPLAASRSADDVRIVVCLGVDHQQ